MFNSPRIKKVKNQANLIFNARLLSSLSPLQRHEFLQLCHRREYREGEVIYYQNDPGTGMYFIESGRVELIASGFDKVHTGSRIVLVIDDLTLPVLSAVAQLEKLMPLKGRET